MSDILIIKSDMILKNYNDIYEGFVNQKAHGVVLLPAGFEAIVVPEDVEIKMDAPKTKKTMKNLYYSWHGHPAFKCSECGFAIADYYAENEKLLPNNDFRFCPCCGAEKES